MDINELPITPKTVNAKYIVGGTLTRVQVLKVVKHNQYNDWICAVREISDEDFDGGCDACDKQHSPIRVNCSMNNKIKLKATNLKGLYLLGQTNIAPIIYKYQFDIDFAWRNSRTVKKGYTTFRILHQNEHKKTKFVQKIGTKQKRQE